MGRIKMNKPSFDQKNKEEGKPINSGRVIDAESSKREDSDNVLKPPKGLDEHKTENRKIEYDGDKTISLWGDKK